MRERIVAGNWKMNTSPAEGLKLAQDIARRVDDAGGVTVVLFPPTTHLASIADALRGTPVELGAQNVHWEDSGAFTGEISAEMLLECGCRWVIVGHSERRRYFGENDETVNRRAGKALESGLRPIVCIGETLSEREAGLTFDVLARQIEVGLEGLNLAGRGGLVVAYEPVWAIGTGHTATPGQADEAHRFIRGRIASRFGEDRAESTVIQYGGSVNDRNAAELLSRPDIDGALVGGASLDAGKFAAIVQAAVSGRR